MSRRPMLCPRFEALFPAVTFRVSHGAVDLAIFVSFYINFPPARTCFVNVEPPALAYANHFVFLWIINATDNQPLCVKFKLEIDILRHQSNRSFIIYLLISKQNGALDPIANWNLTRRYERVNPRGFFILARPLLSVICFFHSSRLFFRLLSPRRGIFRAPNSPNQDPPETFPHESCMLDTYDRAVFDSYRCRRKGTNRGIAYFTRLFTEKLSYTFLRCAALRFLYLRSFP